MSWVRWGAPLTDDVDYCKEHGLTSDLYIYLRENEVVVCFAETKKCKWKTFYTDDMDYLKTKLNEIKQDGILFPDYIYQLLENHKSWLQDLNLDIRKT